MSVHVIDTIKPKNNGTFPVAEAGDIKVTDYLRLDEAFNYVTPQMFGAIGDGITDDTQAFKDALDQNTTVFVPQGIYLITETLEIKDTTPLIGESMVRTKLKFNATNTILLKFLNDRCILRDIQLLGSFEIAQVGTSNTNTAVSFGGHNYHKIENLYIKGFNYGIYSIPNGYGTYIKNSEIQSCNYGVDSSSEFNMITLDTCIVTFCDIGIRLGQGRTQNVINCNVERNRIGVVKNNAGNCLISGCYFENNGQYSIHMSWGMKPVDEMIISNNSFYSGLNYRAALIAYHGNATSILRIEDNCMQSSVPDEGDTVEDVAILEGYTGTVLKPTFKNNWYSDHHVLSAASIRLNAYNDNSEYYYASTETDFNNIVTDSIKRFRFLFDDTKTIKLPILSALKRPTEIVEFVAYGTDNQKTMTILNNPQSYGYAVIGITKIYPNRIYKAVFNRRVNSTVSYDEIIVFGGDESSYTKSQIDVKIDDLNDSISAAAKNHSYYYIANGSDFNNVVTDSVKRFRFDFDPQSAITMVTFGNLTDPTEPIEFFTIATNETQPEDYMQIRSSSNYNILGVSKIYPNKLYKAYRNRVVSDKEEIIVIEG